MICSFAVQQADSLVDISRAVGEDVPLNAAGLTTEAQTHGGLGRQHELLIVLPESQNREAGSE